MSRRFYPPTLSDIGLHEARVYGDVHRERIRAHAKHDANGGSMERKDFDDPSWLSVLVEEVGEVAKELCDHRHAVAADQWSTPDEHRAGHKRRLREELVQVAAMAVAWLDAIDLDVAAGEPEGEPRG